MKRPRLIARWEFFISKWVSVCYPIVNVELQMRLSVMLNSFWFNWLINQSKFYFFCKYCTTFKYTFPIVFPFHNDLHGINVVFIANNLLSLGNFGLHANWTLDIFDKFHFPDFQVLYLSCQKGDPSRSNYYIPWR